MPTPGFLILKSFNRKGHEVLRKVHKALGTLRDSLRA
jgi:hypothetical protein